MLDVTQALYWLLPELNAQAGKQEPSPVVEGMLAYADGTNWNPGSGRGFYKYIGSWQFWGPVPITPSAQSVVTGSRTLGTAYRNTSGKPMFVAASIRDTASSFNVSALTDSANPPTTTVMRSDGAAANFAMAVSFVVLPGNYYKVTSSGGGSSSVLFWTEWT